MVISAVVERNPEIKYTRCLDLVQVIFTLLCVYTRLFTHHPNDNYL